MWPRVMCKRRHRASESNSYRAKLSLGALRAAALGTGDKPQRQSPSLGLALPDRESIRRHDRRLVLFVDPGCLQSWNHGELWITLIALRWWRNNFRFLRLSE